MFKKLLKKIHIMFFSKYVIKRLGDKYYVAEKSFFDLTYYHYLDKISMYTWTRDFIKYCLVDSCEEAHRLIKRRKEYLHELKLKEKEEKIKQRAIRKGIAWECYDN